MTAVVVNMHPQRWHPDENLTDAALAGRIRVCDLDAADRAWVVASLTHSGTTTDLIAEHLHCSRRLVQQIRREPMAVVVKELLNAQAEVTKAKATAKANRSGCTVTQLVHELDRVKETRDDLITQMGKLRQQLDQGCPPPQVIVMHANVRRRRRRPVDETLPLFTLEES
ncbi:hypothetical protein [Rhodococcus koreensis]